MSEIIEAQKSVTQNFIGEKNQRPMSHNGSPVRTAIKHFSLSVAMATNQNEKFAYYFMLGGGLLNKQFLKCSVKISAIRQQLKPIFIFPIISLWKLSCHSNQSAYATAINNNTLVEANAMNISAKFQLYPPYSF